MPEKSDHYQEYQDLKRAMRRLNRSRRALESLERREQELMKAPEDDPSYLHGVRALAEGIVQTLNRAGADSTDTRRTRRNLPERPPREENS